MSPETSVVDPWAVPTTCIVPSCGRPAKAHGLCASHYVQQRRGVRPKPLRNRREESVVQVVTAVAEEAAAELEKEARETGTSVYVVAQAILERWAGRRK